MKQLNGTDFQKEVADFKGIVVADFYADWCGPCKMLSPIMEQLDKENKDDKVKFVKINVDQEQSLAGVFGVMSIPTVIFFKDGKIANQQVGVLGKEEYQEIIEKSKSAKKSSGKKEVMIFTTPTCPYCHMAKDYLKEKHIEFKEIDVSNDQASAVKMVQKSGQMGVPQLWIDNQVVMGFNRSQIDMLLGL